MLLHLLAADATREDEGSKRVTRVNDDWLVRGVDRVSAERRQAWQRWVAQPAICLAQSAKYMVGGP